MILDIIIVIVLMISAAIAFFRGLIKETLTILGVGGAAGGAFLFGGKVVELFQGWMAPDDPDYEYFGLIPSDILALILAYLAVFIVIFVALTILSHFISKSAQAMGLGPIDRSLGIFFGIARGILLLGILYLPFILVMPKEDFPDFVKESRLMPVIDTVVEWTIETANIEGPLEDITPDEENIKESIDAIDKVRDGYISPEGEDKAQPENNESGYEKEEREAFEDLIENEALNE